MSKSKPDQEIKTDIPKIPDDADTPRNKGLFYQKSYLDFATGEEKPSASNLTHQEKEAFRRANQDQDKSKKK